MELFEKVLCPAFEKVQFNPRAIFNEDKSAFFRKILTNCSLMLAAENLGKERPQVAGKTP